MISLGHYMVHRDGRCRGRCHPFCKMIAPLRKGEAKGKAAKISGKSKGRQLGGSCKALQSNVSTYLSFKPYF